MDIRINSIAIDRKSLYLVDIMKKISAEYIYLSCFPMQKHSFTTCLMKNNKVIPWMFRVSLICIINWDFFKSKED